MVLAAAWKQISYNFLFFLAGLQAIPKAVIEAAAIDGAGPGRRFWRIVFPLLSPTTFFLVVVNIVYAFFETFGIIHAVTFGGPAKATETLIYKVFNDGVHRPGFRRLGRPVGRPDGHRHRAHRRPVSLHRAAGGLLMVERAAGLDSSRPTRCSGSGSSSFAFPLYVTLVPRPIRPRTSLGQLPLWFGTHAVDNYARR